MADNCSLQPMKSSNEILLELFGAFNVEPPELLTTAMTSETNVNADSCTQVSNKTVVKPPNKHKKSKKRHKKPKKRKRHDGSVSYNSDGDNNFSKNKHKKKHKKHKIKKVKQEKDNVIKRSDDTSEGDDGNSVEDKVKKEKKRKLKRKKKQSDKNSSNSSASSDNNNNKNNSDESSDESEKKIRLNIMKSLDEIIKDDVKKVDKLESIDSDLVIISDSENSEIKEKSNYVQTNTKALFEQQTSESAPSESGVVVSKNENKKQVIKINLFTTSICSSNEKVGLMKQEDSDNFINKIVLNKNVNVDCDNKEIEIKNKESIENSNDVKAVDIAFVKENIDSTVKPEKKMIPEKRKLLVGSKIMIKNLKNSTVFEETVRQVEEQARLKAERYEEGEISDDSSNNDNESKSGSSKVLSPPPLSPDHSLIKISADNKLISSPCHTNKSVEKQTASFSDLLHHQSHTKKDNDISQRSKSREKHKPPRLRSVSKSSGDHSRNHRSRSKSKDKDKYSIWSSSRKKHTDHHKHRHHHHHRHHSSRRRSSTSPSDRDYHRKRNYHKRYSKSKSRSRSRTKSRSRSRSPYKDRRQDCQEKIDKPRLLEIARKNALNMLKQNNSTGSSSVGLSGSGVEQTKATIAAGGKTVDELTDFCKLLSKKDAEGHESISSNTSNNNTSDSESEKPFHHPFQIKDRPQSIVMNIRNSVAVPVKTLQEKTAEQSKALRMQFPVSSGQLHRKKESDWVPVSPKRDQPSQHFGFGHSNNVNNNNNITTAVVQPMPIPVAYPGQHMMVQPGLGSPMLAGPQHQPPLPPGPGQPVAMFHPPMPPEQVFGGNVQFGHQQFDDQQKPVDITTAVTHRLSAMKRLQQNPNDVEAMVEMNRAQQEAQAWVQSKYEPGQFTGTTGARVLSQAELASGTQAWARRDQLSTAAPVQSGMGMAMLQKMGWRPGEGLGKNKEGTLEPLKLHVKMDKKGLVAPDEIGYNPAQSKNIAKNFYEGKHPVSLLNELCSRKRYGPPIFDCCYETGPDHKKNFIFKVTVNGVEYKPSVASQNKKQAKVEAATLCLRALGLIY
ncbi:uncharacterized protein LOC142328268 isoform X2 [Lycorma delicatula]|uniref:uncharacterized protein LOC142328268 isoform X2 n=1 Tax=Lycorma delicatula TaxID=130591 RepID=UPI003F51605D